MSSSDRILRLLEEIVSESPRTQSELAGAASLPRTTAFNLLSDLRRLGYVEIVDRRYVAGPRLMALGFQVTQQPHLPHGFRPTLERIAAETGETVLLMVETGGTREFAGDLLLVDQVESSNAVRYIAETPGTRPIYPAAAGKVILAFSGRPAAEIPPASLVRHTERTILDPAAIDAELAQIRARGYAVTTDERIAGMTAIAAPVLDPGGSIVSAIVVVGPSERLRQPVRRVWPVLRDAIRESLPSTAAGS